LRGVFARTLKKKLGLEVTSDKDGKALAGFPYYVLINSDHPECSLAGWAIGHQRACWHRRSHGSIAEEVCRSAEGQEAH
jgi:hypothetical protein